jgi:hypothetical protein
MLMAAFTACVHPMFPGPQRMPDGPGRKCDEPGQDF